MESPETYHNPNKMMDCGGDGRLSAMKCGSLILSCSPHNSYEKAGNEKRVLELKLCSRPIVFVLRSKLALQIVKDKGYQYCANSTGTSII